MEGTSDAAVSVLLVDDDAAARFGMQKLLSGRGHAVQTLAGCSLAIEELRKRPYEVVVTDLELPDGDGTQVVEWIGSHAPSITTVVVSAHLSPQRRDWLESRGVTALEKPVEQDALVAAVERALSRRGFFGVGIEVELFDYVQMIALSGRDKCIEVDVPGGRSAKIWFEHGDIVHVMFEGAVGEEAFYKLLGCGVGKFREHFFIAPEERSIFGSSMHLLMEAARRADEGELGASQSASAPVVEQTTKPYGSERETSSPSVSPSESGSTSTVHGLRDPSMIEDISDSMVMSVVYADESGVGEASRSGVYESAPWTASESGSMINPLDDPETRKLMLGQFFAYEGVSGVAILSSTGKVLAEELRSEVSLLTLAGFLMRGAARIARTLGQGVFDGVIAQSVTGRKLLMVAMGATSAVLVLDDGVDADALRLQILEDQ